MELKGQNIYTVDELAQVIARRNLHQTYIIRKKDLPRAKINVRTLDGISSIYHFEFGRKGEVKFKKGDKWEVYSLQTFPLVLTEFPPISPLPSVEPAPQREERMLSKRVWPSTTTTQKAKRPRKTKEDKKKEFVDSHIKKNGN
jgi:hypothetical protein